MRCEPKFGVRSPAARKLRSHAETRALENVTRASHALRQSARFSPSLIDTFSIRTQRKLLKTKARGPAKSIHFPRRSALASRAAQTSRDRFAPSPRAGNCRWTVVGELSKLLRSSFLGRLPVDEVQQRPRCHRPHTAHSPESRRKRRSRGSVRQGRILESRRFDEGPHRRLD